MDNILWTPWRGQYVTTPKSDGCVFCDKVRDITLDRENLVFYRGQYIFAVMNLYPYNNGHIMLLPCRHVADITDLAEQELSEMASLLKKSIQALKNVYNPDGFNIGINMGSAAGAGIAGHLHQHIVPRWNGDTNFMPVLTGTKTIFEVLDVGWDRLKEEFNKI